MDFRWVQATTGMVGRSNLLKVHVVGDILVSGQGINNRSAFGKVCVARNEAEAFAGFEDGDILVIPYTTNELLPSFLCFYC